MVEVIHVPRGEAMPDMPDEEPWLMVEPSDDGRFFGTGHGRKPNGEDVFYASLPESDLSLEAALAAAKEWAATHGVRRIWVQVTPN